MARYTLGGLRVLFCDISLPGSCLHLQISLYTDTQEQKVAPILSKIIICLISIKGNNAINDPSILKVIKFGKEITLN